MSRPYYEDGAVTIYHGDCRDVLPTLRADVVLTDGKPSAKVGREFKPNPRLEKVV